jgi:hypothetical protein
MVIKLLKITTFKRNDFFIFLPITYKYIIICLALSFFFRIFVIWENLNHLHQGLTLNVDLL